MLSEEKKTQLYKIYFSVGGGKSGAFTGFYPFYKAVKSRYPTITVSEAREFYGSQDLSQTHYPVKRPGLFREIHAYGLGMYLAMDGLYLGSAHRFLNFSYAYTGDFLFSFSPCIL